MIHADLQYHPKMIVPLQPHFTVPILCCTFSHNTYQDHITHQVTGPQQGYINLNCSQTCLSGKPSYEILSAFFYGRAFAVTLSKRLGEVVVDGISEVSKLLAEQPQWTQDFQVNGTQGSL